MNGCRWATYHLIVRTSYALGKKIQYLRGGGREEHRWGGGGGRNRERERGGGRNTHTERERTNEWFIELGHLPVSNWEQSGK